MAQSRSDQSASLLVRSGLALGLSQSDMGELLGVSRSTVVRWTSHGFGNLVPTMQRTLVQALHPVDPDLAAAVAAHHHETLESLGVVAPPPAVSPAPAPAPKLHPLVVDTVVCVAAEMAGEAPAAMRPVLLAAFERAQLVGLSVEAVVAGLRAGMAGKAERSR